MPNITMTGATDVGRVRRANEDSYRLLPHLQALVVCDGMGGHAAGEVASQQAVDVFATYLEQGTTLGTSLTPPDMDELSEPTTPPVQAIRLANRSVFETAQAKRSMRGMGTTLVSVQFHEGYAAVYHVGDSRAYRFAGGRLEPLTEDHSLLAELKAQGEITAEQEKDFPERNVITRALGTHPSVQVDVKTVATQAGEWFVLCSDGLCGYIDDPDIERVLGEAHPNAEAAVNALIDTANEAGGHDNVTVAIAVVEAPGGADGTPDIAITVPQSSYDDSIAERKVLVELGKSDGEIDDDDADTDRIKIVNTSQNSGAGGEDQPERDPDQTDPAGPQKRGIWPWK